MSFCISARCVSRFSGFTSLALREREPGIMRSFFSFAEKQNALSQLNEKKTSVTEGSISSALTLQRNTVLQIHAIQFRYLCLGKYITHHPLKYDVLLCVGCLFSSPTFPAKFFSITQSSLIVTNKGSVLISSSCDVDISVTTKW